MTTARPVSTARSVAAAVLGRIEHDGAYANLVLPAALARSGLDTRDRAFATDLVYGTTRMRRACDALVEPFLLTEPEPEVRTVLRLGAYQLGFAGVPAHAAVSETVGLAPKRARGFVNAVLRRVARTPVVWPDEATRLSYPDWIVHRLRDELGDDPTHGAVAALERMNAAPPVSERADGYVQDLASQWVAAAVGAGPGDLVLDVASAPGGKSTAMAAAGAFVVGADRAASRAGLVAANARRLASDVAVVVADGASPPFPPATFDRVLLDAPCSGLGALRRRPDARWRITESALDDLVGLQRRLIAASTSLVRSGGVFVYSVCTLTAAESIGHGVPDGFEVDTRPPDGAWRSYGHGWRVLPQDADTDGMVLIRYRRSA
jgi:16S rRNA (cytosine967-C5)-methyltransferase